jgi:ABC-2 type transport system permease protein
VKAVLHHAWLGLRLNARNPMALVYGFVFPLIFLVAFWAIYRHERPPLALHLGQILTVTVLGGACFGLPTTLVAERERGVWRRYRLTPAPAATFVASTLIARVILLAAAAILQLALAMAIGMPAPKDPVGLAAAFALSAFAFLGLGLVIAALADSVPAVQALGQCIFLPMLMVGGVAVALTSLPDWALHLSAFLPGRYAVQAMQAAATGAGLSQAGFDLLALALIGAAAALAAARMFRWGPADRPLSGRGKGWLLVPLGMWLVVGAMAEAQGRVRPDEARPEALKTATDFVKPSGPIVIPQVQASPAEGASKAPSAEVPAAVPAEDAPQPESTRSWRAVGPTDYGRVAFDRLPPDTGVIAPVAAPGGEVDPLLANQLRQIETKLLDWPPGRVSDPVQRVRNLLIVAAVPDVLQMDPLERHLPQLVLERLQYDTPPAELRQLLFWVAMHPDEGDHGAIYQLGALGLPADAAPKMVRERTMIYAFKLLGRLTGDIPPEGAKPG